MGVNLQLSKKRWTKEETDILEKYYNISTQEEITLKLPGRDYSSIMRKASKMGIVSKRSKWTEGDIEKLKRLYPISNMKTLCMEFPDKTEQSISSKVKQLKLKKAPDYDGRKNNKGRVNTWSDYEDSILKLHYPYGGYVKVMEELPARTKQSIQNRARVLGVRNNSTIEPIWDRKVETIEDSGINRTVKVIYTKL